MVSEGGSHLKQGSRLAIFMVIIDDKVPSNAPPHSLKTPDIELALSAEDCRTSQKQNWGKCIGIIPGGK